MQLNTNNEHELVKICMAELCSRANLPAPDRLVQRDMVALCDTIESNTGVLISLSTIKRLLNGQFARLPQTATLDAIASSAGYQHWRDFAQTRTQVQPHPAPASTSGPSPIIASPNTPIQKAPSKARYLIVGMTVAIISIAALALFMSQKPAPANIDKAHFSAAKVTGNDIPNTVIFKYNVDSVTADSFFIQQSWDVSRRVRVYKHNYTLTDIYYEPGYHTAKLIADDKIIKTVPVSIPTDRWLFYAIENKLGSNPKYIAHPDSGVGMIHLPTDEIVNSKVDIQKANVYCETYFPSKIEYTSDNFTLKCRVRVKPINNEACPILMTEIYCQNYFMYFKSTPKGCTSVLTAQFGDHEFNGRSSDLSGLGANVRDWQDLEFTVRNKKVSISINGQKTFTTGYTQSAGLITGVGFISNGVAEVQWLDLKTADGHTIYTRGDPITSGSAGYR